MIIEKYEEKEERWCLGGVSKGYGVSVLKIIISG